MVGRLAGDAIGLKSGGNHGIRFQGLLVEAGAFAALRPETVAADGREVATSVWNYEHGEAGVILSRDPNLARQHPADYIKGGETENPAILIWMSHAINYIYRIVFGLRVKDVSNSFRIYRGEPLRASIGLEAPPGAIPREFLPSPDRRLPEE